MQCHLLPIYCDIIEGVIVDTIINESHLVGELSRLAKNR